MGPTAVGSVRDSTHRAFLDSGVAIRLPAIKHQCVMRQITRDEARRIAAPLSRARRRSLVRCLRA